MLWGFCGGGCFSSLFVLLSVVKERLKNENLDDAVLLLLMFLNSSIDSVVYNENYQNLNRLIIIINKSLYLYLYIYVSVTLRKRDWVGRRRMVDDSWAVVFFYVWGVLSFLRIVFLWFVVVRER